MVLLEYLVEEVVEEHKFHQMLKLRVVLEVEVLVEVIIITLGLSLQPMEWIKQEEGEVAIDAVVLSTPVVMEETES